jgi:hypothetical protein
LNAKRLKYILWSKDALGVLDSTDVRGGDWMIGGCGILADALEEHCPTGEVWAVWNDGVKAVEHVVYKTPQGYFDGTGLHATEKGLLRSLSHYKTRGPISLRPYRGKTADGFHSSVAHDDAASSKLAELFREKGLGC